MGFSLLLCLTKLFSHNCRSHNGFCLQGKVSVMSSVLADYPPGTRSLWKQKPCPFVYIYDKISDLDICIDAR